jgi:histidinol-phosphate aminotransferase
MELRRAPGDLFRPDLEALEEYVPIEPVEVLAERLGVPPTEIVKLDANENPYGCSLRVQEALASFDKYHIYPDPNQRELRQLLASYSGFSPERILAGSGSDELIDMIMRLFIAPGDEIIVCPPTFGMYSWSARLCGGQVVTVPRDERFQIDTEAIRAAIGERTKLIFLASPNNPTGNLVSLSDVVKLLQTKAVVVVDEAYYEFAGVTVAPLVEEFPNLIVLRTFSKWAGLAGLRIGYGIFPKEIVAHLWKIKQPYNVNVAAQLAVKASLEDLAHLKRTVQRIRMERGRLFRQLRKLNLLEPYPSAANFILCKVTRGSAKSLKKWLEQRGIFVRYFDTPYLSDYIRISVGRPEDTDRLMRTLLEAAAL